ncbi:RNA polymerase III subunit E [Brevipalpus obovatus]|uniref:RNA polymerase III subunit E n=1 Tax=Brevipalpus obovatus TaxID=246614 RepID=UPI003D9ECED2
MDGRGTKRTQPADDYVVKEMDVFVCNNLAPKLHVFQFPSGFEPLANDKNGLLGVKVKMESKRFTMDVKIDTRSRNFDRGKSEQIAFHANNGEEPYFPSKFMNKMVLKSFECKPSNLQYAIGLIKNDSNELHLTPVNSVIQFRPSFDYFDKKELKKSSSSSKPATSNGLAGPSTSKEPSSTNSTQEDKKDEDMKRILMRFERPDEERIKKARESSFTFIRQKVANEPWIDVNVNHRDSGIAMIERQNLIYRQSDHDYMNGYANPDVLMAGDVDNGEEQMNGPSSIEDYLKPFALDDANPCIASLNRVKSVPISSKVLSIMLSAKVASFNDLKEILTDVPDDVTLTRTLAQHALVVRGNWVIKSEKLHAKDENIKNPTSPMTGIPIELLCRARDYILWSFTQSSSLNRSDLVAKTKIPGEEVLGILQEAAVFNPSTKLWDFILPQDDEFIRNFPDVVDHQTRLWNARIIQLEKPSPVPNAQNKGVVNNNNTPNSRAKRTRKGAATTPCS